MSTANASAAAPQTPFDALGGEAAVRALVDAFYDIMDADPAAAALRAMHGADLGPMRERLADWLSGWLGGPPVYNLRHPGRGCIVSAHRPLPIGVEEAEQWMHCIRLAMEQVAIPAEWRGPLDQAFGRMCEGLRSR